MTSKVFISQSDRFNKNHGLVFRSSGLFYLRSSPAFKTTITLWNHFKHKNGAEAALVASLRDMDGDLVGREQLSFEDGNVINYAPLEGEEFEGSVEIEAFSATNLKIPFTAIAALYEAPGSASLVHAYGRAYSQHEIEEGRTVSIGREIGWTLRDSADVKSFCVFHNGSGRQAAQTVHLRVRNQAGDCRSINIELPELPSYATVRLEPADHMPDLVSFLGGEDGSAALDFDVNGAFTRMLVGNETVAGEEFQVTHSNFNYAEHQTEMLPDGVQSAYMMIPDLNGRPKRVLVYPEFSDGQYSFAQGDAETHFSDGQMTSGEVQPGQVTFNKENGAFPARIVTGLVVEPEGARLPAEVSLNVFHARKPDKRLSWGVCGTKDRLDTALVITDLAPIKGAFPEDGSMEVRLYAAHKPDFLSARLTASDMGRLSQGIAFDDLFDEASAFLGGETGFFTVFSEYGGLICYTLVKGPGGSLSLEHSF